MCTKEIHPVDTVKGCGVNYKINLALSKMEKNVKPRNSTQYNDDKLLILISTSIQVYLYIVYNSKVFRSLCMCGHFGFGFSIIYFL